MQDSNHCLKTAMQQQHIGLTLQIVLQQFRRRFEMNAQAAKLDDVTMMHGRILGFLAHTTERDIYQRDIEEEFHIHRSTVTAVMQVMEKNGLIERHAVPNDNRLKQVTITPRGLEMHRRSIDVINQTEAQMRSALSQAELDAFFSTLCKMENNLAQGGNSIC